MPWEQSGSGYTKRTKSGRGGGFVRNPHQYEKLRSLGMSKQRAAAITNSDNVAKSAFGIDHGAIAKAGLDDVLGGAARGAGKIVGGAKRGIELGGQGHTPLGQIGSGRAFRPTYGTSGGSVLRRLGIHSGVLISNTPTLAAGGALGAAATVGARKVAGGNTTAGSQAGAAAANGTQQVTSKAAPRGRTAFDPERQRSRRQNAYEGAASAGAVGAGTVAVGQARHARKLTGQKNELLSAHRMKDATARQSIERMTIKPGTKGNMPRSEWMLRRTANLMRESAEQRRGATQIGRKAAWAARRSRSAGLVSLGAAGTAYGVHRHAQGAGRTYSYR